MANLQETGAWAETLYRIQVNDPILGGEEGVVNIQPKQLANRTRFLLNALLRQHGEDGRHAVTDAMVSQSAGVVESKLALAYATADLETLAAAHKDTLARMLESLTGVFGADGRTITGIVHAMKLLWEYADFGFEFEMWTQDLVMRDAVTRVVTQAYVGDDSIDCDTTDGLLPGSRLLMYSGGPGYSEEVAIRQILDHTRVLLEEPVKGNGSGVSMTGLYFGQTSWEINANNYAVTRSGPGYISRVSYVLENYALGRLLIRREDNGGILKVYHRTTQDAGWTSAPLEDVVIGDGCRDEFYEISGGQVQIKIQAQGAAMKVYYMALFPLRGQTLANIRRPTVLYPKDQGVIYRDEFFLLSGKYYSAYNDPYAGTQFEITGNEALVYDSPDRHVLIAEDVPLSGDITVRCRHLSDLGEWSQWSNAVRATIMDPPDYFGFGEDNKGFGDDAPMRSLADALFRFGFDDADMSQGFGLAPFAYTAEDEG
jgi:hypothetical protein